ncbi:MAG: hypothetical protein E7278_09650 [Lachnospiraceae bacterium]|nr:hypothetical protein [Lachnospiraceae bacterium]
MGDKKKKQRDKDLINAGITGAAYETVQKYGSANKEFLVAHTGIDYEKLDPITGKPFELQKSLNSINAQATNPQNEFSIQQQKAGWAAEVKDAAKTNAENIIDAKSTRKIRHDDLPNTPANHPLFDHVEIDAEGNVIAGSGTQMKFIGASAKDLSGIGNAGRAVDELCKKDFRKYAENGVKIEVPRDEYSGMIDYTDAKIAKLEGQLEKVRELGKDEVVAQKEAEIEYLKKLKSSLKPSKLTRAESVEAVNNPQLSTLKSITGISHRAGLKTAETSAIIGGSVSIVKNIVAVCKGEEEPEEALKNVAKDTLATGGLGYATGFTGSAIKGAMQNSKSSYVRNLSKTNIAGTIVAVTVSATKTLSRYFSGEIDGVECMETLGEQGTGMIASAMFSAIGQIAIPIPVVGGLIGGMVGYALSSATYGVLVGSLKDAKLAHEERIAIEKACEEQIEMIRGYRAQLNAIINEYLAESMDLFDESFSGIKDALAIGDVDLLIDSANAITDSLGGNKPFETMEEFNNKMLSGDAFML